MYYSISIPWIVPCIHHIASDKSNILSNNKYCIRLKSQLLHPNNCSRLTKNNFEMTTNYCIWGSNIVSDYCTWLLYLTKLILHPITVSKQNCKLNKDTYTLKDLLLMPFTLLIILSTKLENFFLSHISSKLLYQFITNNVHYTYIEE